MTDLAVADLSHIPVSQGLAATLTRASEGARATGAREVSLEHVLAALCDDADAADVLAASHIDPARLKSETIAYLAQRDDGVRGSLPGGQIAVSAALMRILEAAAAAARGGRRRDINGAIVLAAIVGDGASMAAQLLQKHGLTFDGAIRALQAALAQPQRHEMPTMAPAEDVLARARERVQSRAAPSLRDIMLEKGQVPEKPPMTSQPGGFPDTALSQGAPPELNAQTAPSPQTGGSPPQPAKSDDEIGETLEQIRSASPAVKRESSAKTEPTPASAPDAGAMVKPPSEPPPGPLKPDPIEPRQHGSSDTPPAPAPNQQAGGAKWQPPVEAPSATPAGPPPWVKTASGPVPSPPAPAPAPPPSPAPPQQVQPMGASQGHPPGQAVSGQATAPTAMPLPPGLEVRRTGGPQPPPIPPPMPKSSPNQGGFGAQSMTRAPQPPPAIPSGMSPPGPSRGLPGMPPLGRPQGAPSGVVPQPPKMPAPAPANNAPAAPAAARAREATPEPAKAELGQLTENISRTMRVGVTERVEIRIGRAHIKNMADGMEGGGLAWQHDVTVTKAMSVRVRAPEGGFFIETASPETQWIDRMFDDGPDYASWRFLITPQQRGWATLRIHISARTLGSEGVAAETAFPDQVIEVKVRTNYGRAAKRTLGWIAAAVAGGVLARFGEGAFDAGSGLISKLLG